MHEHVLGWDREVESEAVEARLHTDPVITVVDVDVFYLRNMSSDATSLHCIRTGGGVVLMAGTWYLRTPFDTKYEPVLFLRLDNDSAPKILEPSSRPPPDGMNQC